MAPGMGAAKLMGRDLIWIVEARIRQGSKMEVFTTNYHAPSADSAEVITINNVMINNRCHRKVEITATTRRDRNGIKDRDPESHERTDEGS